MAVFARAKRVTDPLDDRARARLCGAGSVSSGSEHDSDLSSLAGLVHGFFFFEGAAAGPAADGPDEDGSDSEHDSPSRFDPDGLLRPLLNRAGADAFRDRLHSDVVRTLETVSGLRSGREAVRRSVMTLLRELGYNAGVCKTKWESCGGLTAGNYEFVDVVSNGGQRYIVDVDFRGEFEIARPTEEFSRVLRVLPRVFVGITEDLKQIVRITSEATKRSLKKREMHLPPWRKNRYVQAKWLGPYRRTLNQVPSKSSTFPPEIDHPSVRCRSVGFDLPVGGRRFVL